MNEKVKQEKERKKERKEEWTENEWKGKIKERK